MMAKAVTYLLVCYILKFGKVATVQLRCEGEALGIEDGQVKVSQLNSSSVFNSTTPAEHARLNSAWGSWCASKFDKAPYLEVNFDKDTLVCAIAIQGNPKAGAWVETYQVQSSKDGKSWENYKEDGTRVRDFAGNSDKTTTVKQVLFRGLITSHVRIRPTSWHGLPCMRVELYGADGKACRNTALNVESREEFPDHRMTATSSYSHDYAPYNGRMKGETCWKPRTNASGEYLQLDLGGVYALCAVKTQGNGRTDSNEWTTRFKMTFSLNNTDSKSKKLAGNTDSTKILLTPIGGFKLAKFIRFYPRAYHQHPSMRVELYGSSLGCRSSLGIEVGGPLEDSHITAQPMNTVALNARLYGPSVGCNSSTNAGYLQVDLGGIKTVTGVTIQGDTDPGPIRVGYKYGASKWHWIEPQRDADVNKVLENMTREDDVRTSWFPMPIVARYIRVKAPSYPLQTRACFRLDLHGCNNILRPRISVQTQQLSAVRGSFVNVACKVISQPHAVVKWWLRNKDVTHRSTTVVQSNDSVNNVIVSTLRVNFNSLDDTKANYDCAEDGEGSLKCTAYRCTAHYADDKSGTLVSRSAAIYTILSPVNITEGPSSTKKPLGEGVSLKCVVYGFPVPEITWLQDGVRLAKTTRVNVSSTVDEERSTVIGLLSFKKLERGDSGTYTCKADNQVLDAPSNETAKLTVLEKPGPLEVEVLNFTATSARFRWRVQFDGNSPPIAFIVTLSNSNGGNTWRISGAKFEYNAENLKPGTFYRFRVVAENEVGQSEPERTSVRTKELAPPKPAYPPKLEEARGSTTARITIPKFSDANGRITFYRVLVIRIPGGTEDEAPKPSDVKPKDLMSHADAHESSEPAAYVTFQFKGSEYLKYKVFTVGRMEESDSSQRDRREVEEYYNGPLEPGTKYIIFARAYTSKVTYSDSEGLVVNKAEDPVIEKQTNDSSQSVTIILIASVIGFVVLAVIIVVIVIMFVRRRQTPKDKVVQEDENLSQSPPREVRVEQEGLGNGTKV